MVTLVNNKNPFFIMVKSSTLNGYTDGWRFISEAAYNIALVDVGSSGIILAFDHSIDDCRQNLQVAIVFLENSITNPEKDILDGPILIDNTGVTVGGKNILDYSFLCYNELGDPDPNASVVYENLLIDQNQDFEDRGHLEIFGNSSSDTTISLNNQTITRNGKSIFYSKTDRFLKVLWTQTFSGSAISNDARVYQGTNDNLSTADAGIVLKCLEAPFALIYLEVTVQGGNAPSRPFIFSGILRRNGYGHEGFMGEDGPSDVSRIQQAYYGDEIRLDLNAPAILYDDDAPNASHEYYIKNEYSDDARVDSIDGYIMGLGSTSFNWSNPQWERFEISSENSMTYSDIQNTLEYYVNHNSPIEVKSVKNHIYGHVPPGFVRSSINDGWVTINGNNVPLYSDYDDGEYIYSCYVFNYNSN